MKKVLFLLCVAEVACAAALALWWLTGRHVPPSVGFAVAVGGVASAVGLVAAYRREMRWER